MRVGLIIYGNLDAISGGYLYDRKLVAHLHQTGHQVEVVSLPWRNYAIHLLDNFRPVLLRRLLSARFDVLLQDELNHPSLFWLNRRLRHRVSYPVVSIVHHLRSSEERSAGQNVLYRCVERWYLTSVDGFIFNSQTTRRAVGELTRKTYPSVVAYPAGDRLGVGMSSPEIEHRVHRSESLEIVFVGNLIPRKGLHILLAALGRLPKRGWHLTIVGSLSVDPGYVRAVRRQIDKHGLARAVTFAGLLPDADLARCLSRSSLLAVPSSYEGFGIVYLEGMAFGLPAIASTAGAASEIITHGQNGFLIAPGDAESLAGYLDALMADRSRLLAMSKAAHERYIAHPSWSESMSQAYHFLRDLVMDAPSPVSEGDV